jgi:RNA polymerase sigma factor (sigma-70 family)
VRVAGNEVLRYVERRGRRCGRELPLPETELGAEGARPGAAAVVDERVSVGAALRRLSVLDRTIVALHYYGDVPLPAVATRLGMPVGTVKARLSRARGRLSKELSW